MEWIILVSGIIAGFLIGFLTLGRRDVVTKEKYDELSGKLAILQSTADESKRQIENLRIEKAEASKENSALNNALGEARGRLNSVEESAKTSQTDKDGLNLKLSELISANATLAVERASFETEKKNLQDQLNSTKDELNMQNQSIRNELQEAKKRFDIEKVNLNKELTENRDLNFKNAAERARLETENKNLKEQFEEFKNSLEQLRVTTRTEFELIARNILDGNTKSFSESSQSKLGALLDPLKEKLMTFERKVDEKYNNESVERNSLRNEIERLVKLNNQITTETTSLTQALKGDSKFQGDWGELVLERILEAAGLAEGAEYTFTTQDHRSDSEGNRYRPDVVVKLPDEKHIVVDSKVSLKAYVSHFEAETDADRDIHLKSHLKSIQKHIDELADKNYESLVGVHSPEFVLMFIPVEAAYLTAMRAEPSLVQKAWNKRVAIVTSTTLLTTLKTIASIWKLAKQEQNARQIAEEAAKMYDKFVGFLEDFEKVERALSNGQKAYGEALGKLKNAGGSVFSKMEKLKQLGASPKKSIGQNFLE